MKLTLDSNERVFMIKPKVNDADNSTPRFCNLRSIEACIKDFKYNTRLAIYHYWNGKFQLLSKAEVNEMLTANHFDFQIKKLIA